MKRRFRQAEWRNKRSDPDNEAKLELELADLGDNQSWMRF